MDALIQRTLLLGDNGNDDFLVGYACLGMGQIAAADQNLVRAWDLLETAIAKGRASNCPRLVAHGLVNLAYIATLRGDAEPAWNLARQSLLLMLEVGDAWGAVGAVLALGASADAGGQGALAARLLGACDAAQTTRGAMVVPFAQAVAQRAADGARAQIGEAAFQTEWALGRGMAWEDAYALGLEQPPAPDQLSSGSSDLTPRERQVLNLVGLGYSNRQIAAELIISVRTVETHVERILRKLGLQNRAQVVRYMTAESQPRSA